jgi:predicted dehydrogenase
MWPAAAISYDHSIDAHLEAIRTGPYGRCVYRVDNNVVDHQVVLMEFANDITATFTMTAFTQGGGRKVRIHGDQGELEVSENQIILRTFADLNTTTLEIGPETGGHGGGDNRVIREWLNALHSRNDSGILANAQESLRTHTIVFAAEKSRHEQRMVEIRELSR